MSTIALIDTRLKIPGESIARSSVRMTLAYANGGKLRVRTDQEQQLWSECSRLLLHHLLQCLHPIGIARARRAPAGLPTDRCDQASEPGKLEACEPLRGLQLPGYRRWGRPPGIG